MIAVDKVIDIRDSNILWFRIPGFPGYEISNNNYVRSFKSRKKYPFGTLVKWDNKGNISLTNHNNQRVKLSLSDIWETVKSEPDVISHTWEVQSTARNPKSCVDTEAEAEVGSIIRKPKVRNSEEHEFVDFSNLPDIDLNTFI